MSGTSETDCAGCRRYGLEFCIEACVGYYVGPSPDIPVLVGPEEWEPEER